MQLSPKELYELFRSVASEKIVFAPKMPFVASIDWNAVDAEEKRIKSCNAIYDAALGFRPSLKGSQE